MSSFDQEGRRLVVRLDDSDLVSLIDNTENGQTTPFNCYIGYTSSEYERIYFEFSKLNADIEAKVKHDARGQERREKKRSVTR